MDKPVCPRCGVVAKTENARFCGKCGYRFPAAPSPAPAPLPPVATPSAPPPVLPPVPYTPPPINLGQTPPPIFANPVSVPQIAPSPPFSLHSLRQRIPKPVFFGLNGALGCLLGAVIGELLLALFLPSAPPPSPTGPPVDLMFVVDKTMSMTEEIRGVKDGIEQFAEAFNSRGLASREGLLAFGDRFFGTEPEILNFNGEEFTTDTSAFQNGVSQIQQVNGGDLPESSYDALAEAARQPFRPDAKKILILITDAEPKLPDRETSDFNTLLQLFRERHIDQLHIVTKAELMQYYTPLQQAAPGQSFILEEDGRSGFDQILAGIGTRIAESISSVSSNRRFSADQYRQVLFVTALWTALLAVGITLWLIVGQKLYLRQPLGFDKQILLGAGGGLFAGFIAGSLGQILFTGGGQGEAARIIGWTILGSCIGLGISYFVPNLKRTRAALGGAAGGFVGVIAFVLMAHLLSDWLGRLTGAIILGFCIGLVLALVEMVTREAWLEVTRGANETWIVNLGSTPVRVGSREISEIYVRGIAPDAYRFRLENGKIQRETVATGQISEMRDGELLDLGETVLTVRAQQTAT